MSECAYCHAAFQGRSLYCCHSCELLSRWVNAGEKPLSEFIKAPEIWRKYNAPELEAVFNVSACPLFKKFRLYLDGLQCSSCVHLIEDFHLYCDQVLSARVNFTQGTVEIQTQNELGLGNLCALIAELGYKPTPIKEAGDLAEARTQDTRGELKRIGVAGAVAGNLMLFAVPIYAGLDGKLGVIFRWISFVIFLPLVFYSAVPFYRKAWASLLVRRISIDMMIVVAFLSGFIFSTYSLIVGSEDIYFDSTASFIFLILLTRFFVKRYQDQMSRKDLFSDLFSHEVYEVKGALMSTFVRYDSILKDQLLILKKGQLVPCDSKLVSSQSEFDLAFLTGESLSKTLHQDETVLAGSRVLSDEVQISILQEAQQSELAQSLNQIEADTDLKSEMQSVTDLISHRLTLFVFTVAGAFYLLTESNLGFEAFRRCLALITIACPCAIAFGVPLAHSMALKKAARSGFYMKSATIFEKLLGIKNIVFDKTGTLTSSQLKLVKTWPEVISDKNLSIIRGLERLSSHPIALCVRNAWSQIPARPFSDLIETAGVGVSATEMGCRYRLEKSNAVRSDGAMQVNYFVGGSREAALYFDEEIKPEAEDTIQQLYQHDFRLLMLTGDQRGRALRVAHETGIQGDCVYAEKSPAEKKQIIEKLNPCLFVGDGLNDLDGLSVAAVSFAIKGNFETTFKVSDIYAPQKNLAAIVEIFDLALKVRRTVRRNLAFALVYNVVGGTLALMGLIHPLAAAVLMPISSLLITLNTVWSLK